MTRQRQSTYQKYKSVPYWLSFLITCEALLACHSATAHAQSHDSNTGSMESTMLLDTDFALPDAPSDDAVAEAAQGSSNVFFARMTAEQESDITDRAYPLLAAKWPFNNVFVCWESLEERHFDARATVKKAVMDSWESLSGLKFLGWGPCTKHSQGIRIAIRDEGPHVKFLGKFLSGVKGGMVLNFDYQRWGKGCQQKLEYCNRVIAVHEFGHAIGFAHEQNRPDTPGECDKRQGNDGDDITLTPWDPDSVMNYCNSVYSNNGKLSEFDVLAVQYIYGDA